MALPPSLKMPAFSDPEEVSTAYIQILDGANKKLASKVWYSLLSRIMCPTKVVLQIFLDICTDLQILMTPLFKKEQGEMVESVGKWKGPLFCPVKMGAVSSSCPSRASLLPAMTVVREASTIWSARAQMLLTREGAPERQLWPSEGTPVPLLTLTVVLSAC